MARDLDVALPVAAVDVMDAGKTTPSGRLWTGMLLAPAAWLLSEGVGYVVSSRLCEPGTGIASSGEATHARLLHVVVCLICLVLAVLGFAVAVGNLRALRRDSSSPRRGRVTFMSVGGAFMSALFTVGIVVFAAPALIVNVCNQAR